MVCHGTLSENTVFHRDVQRAPWRDRNKAGIGHLILQNDEIAVIVFALRSTVTTHLSHLKNYM